MSNLFYKTIVTLKPKIYTTPQKIHANWIQITSERLSNMIKGFITAMWEWYNRCKSTNMIHHIHKFKKHMIIILYTEKAFDNRQHPFFMIKILERSEIEIQETYVNSLQQAYCQLEWRKIQTKIRKRQGCRLSQYLCNTVLKFFSWAIRQLKETKGRNTGKGEVQCIYLQIIWEYT